MDYERYYNESYSQDQKLWGLAVWLMDKELGAMGLECHCQGCEVVE